MAENQARISQNQRQAERDLLLGQMRSSVNQKMIAIVQVSWENITPDSRLAASMLAMNLCADGRNIASLFEEDRIKMSRDVMQAVSCIVAGLDQPETLVPCLGSLGQLLRRHGLHESGQQTFATALFLTLGQLLGPRYGPMEHNAWAIAYSFVVRIMIAESSPLSSGKQEISPSD